MGDQSLRTAVAVIMLLRTERIFYMQRNTTTASVRAIAPAPLGIQSAVSQPLTKPSPSAIGKTLQLKVYLEYLNLAAKQTSSFLPHIVIPMINLFLH